MALKGTATIELTDIKTGKKEVIKHDNLVTNAIHDLLTLNPLGMRFRSYSNTNDNTNNTTATDQYSELGSSFEAGMLPICTNAVGGILLFENALEENPDKYFAPVDNLLVGYSSNDVNTTTDKKRGSMNQTESGVLEDGSGYRFVFDFGSDQANGTISSVGLTSARGGKAGYGAAEDKVGYPMLVVDNVLKYTEVSSYYKTDEWYTQNNYVTIDAENNIVYYARLLTAKTIAIGKLKLPMSNIGLVKNTTVIPEVIEETIIGTSTFATVSSSSLVYMNYTRQYSFAGTFIDGDDGFIWGLQHKDNACGNSEGKAKVLWVKISKEDFSFTEGEWELDAQLFPFGLSEYNEAGNYSVTNKQFFNNSIIKDGRLYALKHDRKGVYSINLENITDITLMECDFEIYVDNRANSSDGYDYIAFNTNVIDICGAISYLNAYINGGKIHKAGYGTTKSTSFTSLKWPSKNKALRGNPMTRAHYGPFFLNYCYYYNTSSRTCYYHFPVVWLMTPYLATINNLPVAVEKTAAKTMKITYILREES